MRKIYAGLFTILISLLAQQAAAQVTVSGGSTAAGNYTTLAQAITALNGAGAPSGPVTVNVTAGHTETSDIPEITFSGTQAAPIVIQKSGTGANPVITRQTPGTIASSTTLGSHGDAIISISGGDYITFDGIDLQTGAGFTTVGLIEYGYYLKKASGTDACKNVTIRNCTITLDKAAVFSFGIHVSNNTGTTTGVTVTSVGGRSENIFLLKNTISNSYGGIQVRGFNAASPYDFYDQNITVGDLTTGGNTITNFGGAANTGYGIYGIYQNNLKISYNTINGGTGTTTNVYGIFTSTGTTSSVDINHNNVTVQHASTTSSLFAINNAMGGSGTSNTVNINDNTVSNCQLTAATSAQFYAIYNTASAFNVNMFNNTVHSNSKGGTGTAFLVYNTSTGASGFANLYNNTVRNNANTGAATMWGVYSNPVSTSTSNVYGNVVHSNTVANSNLYGVAHATSGTGNIYRNKVYGLTATGTSGVVYGLYQVSGATTNWYNNIAGDLFTPDATGTAALAGMHVSGGTTVNISFNTIRLAAVSASATTFGSSALYVASATPSVTSRNNILINTSTASGGTGWLAAAFRYSAAPSTTSYTTASNNNLLFAGTPSANNVIYVEGTTTPANAQQTLAAYKTYISSRDQGSVTEDPSFLSTTGADPNYLHINPAVPTRIESGGVPVAGITTDFDGNPRNASTPDIGADEFTGTAIDEVGPNISATALDNVCTGGNRQITATITDPSGVPTSGQGLPVLYFKINRTGTYAASQATSIGSNQFQFNVGTGANPGDSVFYYIVAQDAASTPNVSVFPSSGASGLTANPPSASTPPTSPLVYAVFAGYTGTNFTVGSGGNYATLTEAITDYNRRCLTGVVTYEITGNIGAGETFPIVIRQNPSTSSANRLVIKPAAGVSATITGAVASGALIVLSGADFVTIDGSNNGTASRNLSVVNTSTTSPTAIALVSLGEGAGATNNIIRNLDISTAGTSSNYGISIGGATPGTAGADNDNNTIQNNNITVASFGIYAVGTAATSTGGNDNLVITGNTTLTTTSTAGTATGIRVGNGLNGTVAQNVVSVSTTGSGAPVGISVETGFLSAVISRNNVGPVTTTATGGYGGRGITIGTGSANSNVTVVNNMVHGVNGSNYFTFNNSSSMGIGVGVVGNSTSTVAVTTGNVNIWFNSVNLYGTYSYTPATLTNVVVTAALYVATGATTLDVRNNIFADTLRNTSATATSKNYALFVAGTNAAFSQINYNDYYVFGSQGVLASVNGVDATTPDALRTATGGDLNSLTVEPQFVSNTDLHLNGNNLNNTGQAIASVPVDFDGQSRIGSTPDIGADEYPQVALPVTLTSITAVQRNSGVQVDWTFSQEINMDRYEVEHSATGNQFRSIGTVASRGNSANEVRYTLLDATPVNGANYYRVKMFDKNGQITYTRIVRVNIGSGKPAVSVYPNPVVGDLISLQLDNLEQGNYNIRLMNSAGQVVAQKQLNHAGGSASESLMLNGNVPAGIYQLNITAEGFNMTKQVLRK
jgi:trimeric autotransporter adhesin